MPNKKASDFETKSMLYLLGMRSDSEEIDLIHIAVLSINSAHQKVF